MIRPVIKPKYLVSVTIGLILFVIIKLLIGYHIIDEIIEIFANY